MFNYVVNFHITIKLLLRRTLVPQQGYSSRLRHAQPDKLPVHFSTIAYAIR
jgi:hypothetical protein